MTADKEEEYTFNLPQGLGIHNDYLFDTFVAFNFFLRAWTFFAAKLKKYA